MLSIQNAILCIILSISASFSLWEWMNDGMIFEPYLKWLKKISNYQKSLVEQTKEKIDKLNKELSKTDIIEDIGVIEKQIQLYEIDVVNYEELGYTKATYKWFYKPLGGCIICMNVWISIAILLGCFIGLLPLYPILAVIFVSNLIIIKWI